MTANGEVCGWNKVAEQVFGWPSAETTGRMLADLIIPEIHRAAHAEGLRRLSRCHALRSSLEDLSSSAASLAHSSIRRA